MGIIIADKDGSNQVALTGGHEPYPIPVLGVRKAVVETSQTRYGGPGEDPRLVGRIGGSLPKERSFDIPKLTQAMHEQLLELSASGRGQITADGTTWYHFLWTGDGYEPTPWTSDPARYWKAKCTIQPLGEVE